MAAGKKKPDTSGTERSLRDSAEEQLVRSPKRSADIAEQTPEQLIHELQVHQIELETQAEELRKANNALVESRDRFADLYDFAPIGYLTLTDKALIADVNLTGAKLLGVERSKLVNARFRKFIAPEYFENWDQYFLNVLNREEKLTCTLTLKRSDGSMFPARLEGIRLTGVDGKIAIRIAFSDITDIWQIEALKESEKQFRQLFESASDAVFVLDMETTRIIDANNMASALYGYDHNVLLTMTGTDVSAEPEATLRAIEEGKKEPGQVLTIPLRLHRKRDGTVFPVEITARNITRGNKPVLLIACRDITERKVAEDALRTSEGRLHTLVQTIPDLVWLKDRNGVYLSCNPVFERFFGAKEANIIGKTDYDFVDHVLADFFREHDRKAMQAGKPTSNEEWITFADDGHRAFLETTKTPMYSAGETLIGVLGIGRDITERKRAEEALRVSEEKYRNILENIQDVFYRSDSQGNLIMISPSGASLLGYSSTDEMLGLSIAGRLYANPDDRAVFLEAMKEKGFVRDYEVNLRRKDGSVVTISTNSHYYYNPDGSIAGVEGTLRDITELKQAEDALKRSEEQLRLKLDSVLSPDVSIDEQELANIIDSRAIQSIMENFSRLTGMVTAILDTKGNVLVFTGWQEICTRFHRVNPVTAGFCTESDLHLAKNMKQGEYAAYKCRNHLWDVVTPLYIGSKHMGNIFTGQFFYDDEIVDESVFSKQAETYGFDRDAYLAALHRVPRFSREKISELMDYLVKFTGFISQLSYSNLKLAKTIAEEKRVKDALNLSEQRLSDLINFLPDATFAIDKAGRIITWNKAMEDMTGTKAGDMLGKGNHEYAIPFYGERRPILIDLIFEDLDTVESRYVHVQRNGNLLVAEASVPGTYQGKGAYLWGIASPLYDNEGKIVGAIESIRDINERKMAQDALARTTKKLSLLNAVTFSDIQNAIFSLSAYFEMEKLVPKDEKLQQYLDKEVLIIQRITESLKFANNYQGLGLKAPRWQNVLQSFLLGISHTDISKLCRTLTVEGLEIFADPQLENVFFTLAENIILHGKTATEIALSYRETDNGLVLVFEDNGEGISHDMKEKIFERKDVGTKGMGLFLAREILSITEITITETGEPGKGARFEMTVPKRVWRFTSNDKSLPEREK